MLVDGRKPAFSWIANSALERIRRDVPASRQRGARNALLALAEAASRRRDGDHAGGDTLRELALYGCVSEKRMRGQLNDLADVGLVRIDDARDAAGRDLPTIFVLLDGGDKTSTRGDAAADKASTETSPPTRARETRQEEQEEKNPPSSPAGDDEDPAASDARDLCRLLAELILERDPRAKVRPGGERWQTAMRLLIADRDGDTTEVERVLRWSQNDPFWQANILSPGKLRDQFTKLALRAQRPTGDRPMSEAVLRGDALIREALEVA